MAEFDAELYLRLAGERAVLAPAGPPGHQSPGDTPLGAAANALVAVGAMTAEAAQAIVDDYYLALSYRPGEHRHHHLRAGPAGPRATPLPTLGPLRAVPCRRLIEQPWGQLFLSYVVLNEEATVLHVSMRPALPPAQPGWPARRAMLARGRGPRHPGPRGHMIGAGMPGQLTMTDDRGTSSTGDFSGGGGESGWRGEFEARPPLARDTAWIEVLGERVELPGPPSRGAEVRVEPHGDDNPARAYLWVNVASQGQFHSPGAVDSSIEALVAAGTLAPDDPAIAELRAVTDGFFRRAGPASGRRPLPEPWGSMLARRGRAGGPEGVVVVGATTPPFDGITVALLAVRSTDEGFSAHIEAVPALTHWHGSRVDGPALAWWAADDLGHHYLGEQGSWSSGPDRSSGQIDFWPALDPAARVLDIMPTTMAARAVIHVPLDWGEEP